MFIILPKKDFYHKVGFKLKPSTHDMRMSLYRYIDSLNAVNY